MNYKIVINNKSERKTLLELTIIWDLKIWTVTFMFYFMFYCCHEFIKMK